MHKAVTLKHEVYVTDYFVIQLNLLYVAPYDWIIVIKYKATRFDYYFCT